MGQKTVHSVSRGAWLSEVSMGEFDMLVDEPESVPGGTNQGPNPTSVLLGSVASCFTLALSWSARKLDVELAHLLVDVTGTYDGPKFSSIHIEAEIGCAPEMVEPLIAEARKVCYVTNTIAGGVDLSFSGTAHGS